MGLHRVSWIWKKIVPSYIRLTHVRLIWLVTTSNSGATASISDHPTRTDSFSSVLWVPDDHVTNCLNCNTTFSFFNRKVTVIQLEYVLLFMPTNHHHSITAVNVVRSSARLVPLIGSISWALRSTREFVTSVTISCCTDGLFTCTF